jgi:4-amino-4-deoxy-L-arabinose transferase-like glycosyltransferase
MGTVQVGSIRQETQTWDEGFDLAAGYSYWKTGDFRINREHPPLGKFINALPLLVLNPDLPLDDPSWEKADNLNFGIRFLYQNRVPADKMLFWARLMTILLTLALGAALACWARKRFGTAVALFALLMFVFDPNLIAHGRYVTSDMVVTLFSFVACIAWGEYLLTKRRRDLVLTGVLFGLAVVSKFSALFLVPTFGLMYALRWRQCRPDFGSRRLVRACTAVTVIAALVIAIVYAPEAKLLIPGKGNPPQPSLRSRVNQDTLYGKVAGWIGARLGLRAHSFPVALGDVFAHNKMGHDAYLMGKRSDKGWWYFFPITFSIKTPTAVLIAVLLFFGLELFLRLRPLPFEWWILIVPITVYFGFSISSNINIGIRHLLPIYPFLYVLLSAGLVGISWRGRRYVLPALGILLAAESLAIYPHYLAFFNWPSGGPGNGPKYLVDSNIDWGQDVLKLKKYMVENNIPRVEVCYFGRTEFWYYKIDSGEIPPAGKDGSPPDFDGVAAVSVTPLMGVYVPPEQFAWLRERKPDAKIGYSIYLYDLRKKRSPAIPNTEQSAPATKASDR